MDRPLTADYAKEVANAFVQTYYNSFDNGPRENLSALYVCALFYKEEIGLCNNWAVLKIQVPDGETSQMTFEGNAYKGQQAIVDKLKVNIYLCQNKV